MNQNVNGALLRKLTSGNFLLALFVYIPTLLAGCYLFLVHSPMYISESHFAVRSSDGTELATITSFLFQNNSSIGMDANIIQSHIGSLDMLDKVARRVDFYGHYADRAHDPVSRLKGGATREEVLEFWRKIVTATYNLDKGIITVEVRAYTPEMAKAVNDAILACSEELVNQMNDRAHTDALRLSRSEMQAAEERLLAARIALQAFRDDKSMLDPAATASSLEGIVAGLEAEAAKTQAELTALLQIQRPGSPQVRALERTLEALQKQIVTERGRIAGLEVQGGSLSALVGDYAQLVTEEKFAQELTVKSMAAFEAARLRAISQSRYIVPFQPPTLPEESLYPRPFAYTMFIFFGLLIALGLISLIIAAVRDHMGV